MKAISNTLLSGVLIPLLPPLGLLIIHLTILLSGQDYYFYYPWIDMPMHFLGGIAIFLMLWLFLKKQPPLGEVFYKFPRILQFVFYISLLSFFALSWELMEFILDMLYHSKFQLSLADTMIDLIMGLSGCTIPSAAYVFLIRPYSKIKKAAMVLMN